MKAKKAIGILLILAFLLSYLPVQGMAETNPDIMVSSEPSTETEPTGTPDNPGQDDNPVKPDDYVESDTGPEDEESAMGTREGTCGENLTWELDEDGTLTISGTGEMDGWSLADAPWYDYGDSITTIVIEDGVTSIGVSAFWACERVTSVIIPASVTSVEYYSFKCNENLTILFEGDAPVIDHGAFSRGETIYYPANNPTWLEIVHDYYGDLTWVAYSDMAILKQPKNVPIVPDGTVEFSALGYGDSLTYEWWVAAPGSDTFEKTEVTENTYTVAVDWDSVGLRAYCVVTDGNGNVLQSEIATVTELPTMYEEETFYAEIVRAGQTAYYSFTPANSCNYLFSCYGYDGKEVSLYNSDMTLLAGASSEAYSLDFNHPVVAGVSYILAVRFMDSTATGEIDVYAQLSHSYSYEVVTEATCTVDGQGKYTCSHCSDSYTEVIAAAHQASDDGVCTVCGNKLCGENLIWTFAEKTGTLMISGSGDMYYYYGYGNLPWFDFNEKITSVIIEDGVTSLAAYAFYSCVNLKSVTLGNGLVTIGSSAFGDCSVLESVVIPDSVTELGDRAFVYCTNLKQITLGNGITYIPSWTFGHCTSLTSVRIPDNVTSFDGDAFVYCSALSEVTGCAGVEGFSVYAFGETNVQAVWIDEKNEYLSSDENGWVYNKDKTTLLWVPKNLSGNVVIPDGVTTLRGGLFCGNGSITGVTLPDTLETIGHDAFASTGLTEIVVPDSVTTIEFGAFSNCTDLETVYIGSGVNSIAPGTFDGCSKLTTISVDGENETYSTDAYGVLFNKDYTVLEMAPKTLAGSYTVPATVLTIADGAFSGCTGLKTITLPDVLTDIGYGAFEGCSALTEITIPVGVTYLGDNVFYQCTSLQNVVLPSGLLEIGNYAFYECSALESISLPNGFTHMGVYAFALCPKLKNVVIPDSVTYIGEYAFASCTGLTQITFPLGITRIPNGMLCDTGLTRVEIPATVVSIGDSAFAGCEVLKEVVLPEGLKYIGFAAFIKCNAIERVTIPASVYDLGGYAFGYCTNLKQIEFLGNRPGIGNGFNFMQVTADVYIPVGDDTWTTEVMGYYSNELTWYTSDGTAVYFHLTGANIALGSSLAMNFFVDKDYLSGSDYYAVITHYGHDDLEDGCHVYTIPYSQWEERQDYMVVTLENLAAKNMIDYVDVQLFRGDGTPCTAVWDDSIQDYAMRIFDRQDDTTKTLLVDMLNYGAAAQTYFGYSDTYLANALLTEEQQAYGTQSVTCIDQRIKGENYYGSSLVLENRIQLTMYFRNITADMYAVVNYTDHYGNACEYTVSGADFAQYNSNIYGVTIDTLAVADGDQLVNVAVFDAQGNRVAYAADTVNGYLSRMMSNNALFEAIAKFTASAHTYFETN